MAEDEIWAMCEFCEEKFTVNEAPNFEHCDKCNIDICLLCYKATKYKCGHCSLRRLVMPNGVNYFGVEVDEDSEMERITKIQLKALVRKKAGLNELKTEFIDPSNGEFVSFSFERSEKPDNEKQ